MTYFSRRRSPLALLGAAALGASLLAGALAPGRAAAQVSYCKVDPIVQLSNGAEIDITTQLYTTSDQVKSISYTLHAPAGTTVQSVTYTAGFAGKETLTFYADRSSGYATGTYVTTMSQRFQVTAMSAVRGGSHGSVSGYNNQNLVVNL